MSFSIKLEVVREPGVLLNAWNRVRGKEDVRSSQEITQEVETDDSVVALKTVMDWAKEQGYFIVAIKSVLQTKGGYHG